MFQTFSTRVMPSELVNIDKERHLISLKNINVDFLRRQVKNDSTQDFRIGQYTGKIQFTSDYPTQVAQLHADFTISVKVDQEEVPLYKNKRISITVLGEHMKKLQSIICYPKSGITKKNAETPYKQHVIFKTSLHLGIVIVNNFPTNSLFDLDFLIEINTESVEEKKIILPESNLQKNLPELFEDNKFGDVTLEVKGTELRAHKKFLAAQSPVFATMFKQKEMTENMKNVVKIDDMEPDVARQMLEFVYIDREPSEVDEYADQLLPVSHKYEMNRLNVICQSSLIKTITEENVWENLILAKMYDAEILKQSAIDFIEINPLLVESAEFEEFDAKHHDLANAIYRRLFKKKKTSE